MIDMVRCSWYIQCALLDSNSHQSFIPMSFEIGSLVILDWVILAVLQGLFFYQELSDVLATTGNYINF